MPEHEDIRFPDGFLWGSATSSHQVEGNCTKNDWWQWEQREGFISDGSKSGIACDHYNRFEEDFALAAELGHNAHRLSIEWSRIEPEEGQWDRAEVEHYRRVLESLHRHGLTPLVTLHHFTNPLWLAEKGAWLNPQSVEYIARYSAFIARELGDLVPVWLTINEPMVVVTLGYALGVFPPREREWERTAAAARHLLMAHGRMYQAVHESTGHNPLVGPVKNMPYVMPKDPESEDDRKAAQERDQFLNEYFLAGIDTGTLGPPFGSGEEVPGLKDSWDIIGINYYTRNVVAGGSPAGRLWGEVPDGAETTMMGYEVYPEGLYHGVMRLSRYRRPIYVTENGISTLDDGQRSRHLLRHLREVQRAIREGADVRGYLYWSLMDNFEWVLGYSQKFGMCAIEPETLNRLPRPVAHLYREIATSNSAGGGERAPLPGRKARRVIREATRDDNDALIEMERGAALDLGDRLIIFDRSPDFFARQELEEHGRMLVAEDEGRLVGVVAAAWHDILIGGQQHRLIYIHQGRISPEHRQQRVATDLVIQHLVRTADDRVEAPYWLISPDNEKSLAFGQRQGIGIECWPVDGRLDGFDVSARQKASDRVGGVGADDLPQVLELINGTHAGREMFMPYTAERLQARLSRSPAYGWQHWRGYRSEQGLVAAAGLWDFGRSLRITERDKATGRERVSLPAFVLDYGYAAGAEEAMVEVFMALMETAAGWERNELSIALPTESRLFSLMEALPHSPTLFRILTPTSLTPKEIRGSVYLDPVYV